MRALRSVFEFVTGGSIAAPIGLAIAVIVAIVLPVRRDIAFVAIVALSFVASTFEKPT